MEKMTYQQAGVDVAYADKIVGGIGKLVAKTPQNNVKAGVGGFAGLFHIGQGRHLAAACDGVGTKLKWAQMAGSHHGIGVDLVAMCVNDLLCVGARPLFFLDYMAQGKLQEDTLLEVIEGVTDSLASIGACLLGGETAEMPGMYPGGEYDVAGFAVGEVWEKDLPPGNVQAGDVLIALPSNGFHANGHSLLRKCVSDESLIPYLLTPTKIYVNPVMATLNKHPGKIKAMAHITGGGMDNLLRMESSLTYNLRDCGQMDSSMKEILSLIPVDELELYRTFNMGIGFVMAVASGDVGDVMNALEEAGESPWVLGDVTEGSGEWIVHH